MHYFGNKAGLFTEASRVEVRIPDLTGVPPERVASVLVPFFAADWGPDGRLLPLLRAAASNRAAADALVDMFTQYVAPALGALAVDRPDERAAMIGSQIVGVAVARHIIGLPALVNMDNETLAEWLGPIVAHYLTG